MKHSCLTKIAFPTREKANDFIVGNYIRGRKAYGVYECPKCLDFHLTSKYDNRTKALKRRCLHALLGCKLPTTKHLIYLRDCEMRKHLKHGTKGA